MKKLVALILVALMLLSLSACQNPPIIIDNEKEDDNDIWESHNDRPANEEKNDTTDQINVESPLANISFQITYARKFSDGVAFVKLATYEITKSDEQETKNYLNSYDVVIDASGNILFNITEMGLSISRFLQYRNGVSVYKVPSEGFGYSYCEAVYDKNGNIVISSEKNNYDNILAYSDDNRYFIVDKTEESFTGDKYSVGIIDNSGNYIEALSDTNALAKLGQEAKEQNLYLRVEHVENDIFCAEITNNWGSGSTYYYHANRNTITEDYDHIEMDPYGDLYKHSESGERTQLFPDKYIEQTFDNAVLISEDIYEEYKMYTKYELLDYEGNMLIDLSKYTLRRQDWESNNEAGFYYLNGYFLTQVENSTGGIYCCLFDANGNLVFEPIRMQEADHFYPLSKKGFIYKSFREDHSVFYQLYQYDGTIKELKYVPEDITQDGHYTFEDGPELICTDERNFFFIDEQEKIVISDSTIKGTVK